MTALFPFVLFFFDELGSVSLFPSQDYYESSQLDIGRSYDPLRWEITRHRRPSYAKRHTQKAQTCIQTSIGIGTGDSSVEAIASISHLREYGQCFRLSR
jgi:hypothetical protein